MDDLIESILENDTHQLSEILRDNLGEVYGPPSDDELSDLEAADGSSHPHQSSTRRNSTWMDIDHLDLDNIETRDRGASFKTKEIIRLRSELEVANMKNQVIQAEFSNTLREKESVEFQLKGEKRRNHTYREVLDEVVEFAEEEGVVELADDDSMNVDQIKHYSDITLPVLQPKFDDQLVTPQSSGMSTESDESESKSMSFGRRLSKMFSWGGNKKPSGSLDSSADTSRSASNGNLNPFHAGSTSFKGVQSAEPNSWLSPNNTRRGSCSTSGSSTTHSKSNSIMSMFSLRSTASAEPSVVKEGELTLLGGGAPKKARLVFVEDESKGFALQIWIGGDLFQTITNISTLTTRFKPSRIEVNMSVEEHKDASIMTLETETGRRYYFTSDKHNLEEWKLDLSRVILE